MALNRFKLLMVAALFSVSAAQSTAVAADDKSRAAFGVTQWTDGWTDKENAIWDELAARYGAADVSIARKMFPRASVDTYAYREAVYWLQDQQNTRLDRDKGNSYTKTYRER